MAHFLTWQNDYFADKNFDNHPFLNMASLLNMFPHSQYWKNDTDRQKECI